ncbi:MAG: hypothetical protein K2G85_03390 [Muribaculaceae bacterium]|nr:hypothetical protein [Muribaculaceae bacterium]
MKTINQLAVGAALLFGAAALSSCSEDKNEMIGTWTSSTPEVVIPVIEGTNSATAVTTFEFSEGSEKSNGPVKMTTDYTVTAPDSVGNPINYTVKASVEGKWVREEKGDDDYYLSFDQNTLDVAAVDAPDGLGAVTSSFLGSLAQYQKIEDVEVTDDGSVLSFELDNQVANHDKKVSFTKVK